MTGDHEGAEPTPVPQSAPEPGADAPDHEPTQVETEGRPEGDLPTPPVDTTSDAAWMRLQPAQLPRTGDVQVDEALEGLQAAQDLPLAEQVDAYTGTHRALQDRLADLEG